MLVQRKIVRRWQLLVLSWRSLNKRVKRLLLLFPIQYKWWDILNHWNRGTRKVRGGESNPAHAQLLDSMELVSNNGSFKDAITNLSTTIAQIYPLIGQKGCNLLISDTGTSGNYFKTHVNGVEFTYKNWTECFSNEDYSKVPLQVRKLIQVGKKHREESASNNLKQKASEITQHK